MELIDQYVAYQNVCLLRDKMEKELLRAANNYTNANGLAPILIKDDAIILVNSLAIQFYISTTEKA